MPTSAWCNAYKQLRELTLDEVSRPTQNSRRDLWISSPKLLPSTTDKHEGISVPARARELFEWPIFLVEFPAIDSHRQAIVDQSSSLAAIVPIPLHLTPRSIPGYFQRVG